MSNLKFNVKIGSGRESRRSSPQLRSALADANRLLKVAVSLPPKRPHNYVSPDYGV